MITLVNLAVAIGLFLCVAFLDWLDLDSLAIGLVLCTAILVCLVLDTVAPRWGLRAERWLHLRFILITLAFSYPRDCNAACLVHTDKKGREHCGEWQPIAEAHADYALLCAIGLPKGHGEWSIDYLHDTGLPFPRDKKVQRGKGGAA